MKHIAANTGDANAEPTLYWTDSNRYRVLYVALKERGKINLEAFMKVLCDLISGNEVPNVYTMGTKINKMFGDEHSFIAELVNRGELVRLQRKEKVIAKYRT